jgi:CheY-like chemotaxis protein
MVSNRLDADRVFSTARGGDEYKVEGLLAGADGTPTSSSDPFCKQLMPDLDYLAKPFNARELIARGELAGSAFTSAR